MYGCPWLLFRKKILFLIFQTSINGVWKKDTTVPENVFPLYRPSTTLWAASGSTKTASNSLLESLVFAERAADEIADTYQVPAPMKEAVTIPDYNTTELFADYKASIFEEMEKERGTHNE